ETAEVVRLAHALGRYKVAQRHVRLAVALGQLLAQGEESSQFLLPRVVGIESHVIAYGVGRPETDHGLGRKPFFLDDLLEHRLGIGPKRARSLALRLVLKNGRITALEFPGLEERRPVDIAGDFRQIEIREDPRTEEAGPGRGVARPVRSE